MGLPGDLAVVTVTGAFCDPAGKPLRGQVRFTPNVILSDPGDSLVIPQVTSVAELSGGSFSITLLGTDASQIVPQGWAYSIRVELADTDPYCFTAYLPSADSPLDISELTPLEPVTRMSAYLPVTGGTMTGPLYAASDPTQPLQVATMGWVESLTAGLSAKDAVRLATAAALPANTATNLTLTANMVGALTVDGTSPSLNDRILSKNELNAANNGIYYLSQLGTSMEPWILTRTSDMDTSVQVPGAYTLTQEGTANAGFGFIVSGVGPYTLGTTAISWEQFTSTGDFTAGTGLTLSGQTVSLNIPVLVADGGTGAATAAQNDVFAGPASGGSGAPSFRAITAADIPVLNQNTTGTAAGLSATLAVGSGGTGAMSAPASAAYAAKASAAEKTIYVSVASYASDSNDGLSWGSAKATIAGALTALGSTGSGNSLQVNAGVIQLGAGTWTDTATHVIQGAAGMVIQGAGRGLTFIEGPDAAAWIQTTGCTDFKLKDLTYTGSPSGTGWGYESVNSWTGSQWTGVLDATRNGAENVTFGRGNGTSPACAYGVKFTIPNAASDANNDEGYFRNCFFQNCTTPVYVGHSESLQHTFDSCRFYSCGAGIQFYGGSASIINPVVIGMISGGSGYFLDCQAAYGNWQGGNPDYFHVITVTGAQCETPMNWLNSPASAIGGLRGRTVTVQFSGGDWQAGGGTVGTPAPAYVNWQNTSASAITFDSCKLGTTFSNLDNITIASAATSLVLVNCVLNLVPVINWAGTLTLTSCTSLGTITLNGGTLQGSTLVQWFASSATWNNLPGASAVDVTLLGPGGGGGSGARGPSGDVICGGGAGGGGQLIRRVFSAADLPSGVFVTVGAAGTGGAAVTADSTNGNAGTTGTSSSFGTYCFTITGAPGAGGTFGASSGTGAGGAVFNVAGFALSSGGGSASTTGGAGGASGNSAGPSGGGAGGSITTGGAASAGGATGYSTTGNSANVGVTGAVDGSPPTAGTNPSVKGTPSCGGAGGCSSVTTTAQNGATAFYGGGGGGGGGSLNGHASGAGGNGGPGWALIITHF